VTKGVNWAGVIYVWEDERGEERGGLCDACGGVCDGACVEKWYMGFMWYSVVNDVYVYSVA
jgi:hypothetical protein